MLNDITKKKINSLRQILVGKVPDPKSQVDQITNALIYKYMDDMDRQAEAFGGKAAFFVGEYEKYSWRKLMDPKLGGQDRLNLYIEALEKMSQNKNLSPIFRQILRGAFLPYRSPETLNLFLSEVDGFAYEHSEELGNAYEYLLSIMGSQGDAGQFRTPRHIIDFIVDVIDPKKGDRILDPACGTAGFLISAYKHIIGNHDGKDNETGKPTSKEERLTPQEMRGLHKNFVGYDISPEMVKLSLVNMFLHNFPEPKITEYDTLSDDSHWDDRYEIILANPPFMSPKGGIVPHKRFSISATRAEVLFTDYIVEHLTTKGRAGIIVPEGIIFQSGTAYKQLRKQLVEDGLFAVVSLPSGVFNPYAGVKTSILFFDAEIGKRRDDILFVKVGNDGYDLGAQRREIVNNDLPEAAEVLKAWRKGKRKESPLATWVSREQIAESGDYNLSGDRYRVTTDYTNAKWPMVELGEVCDLESGSRDKGGALDKGVYSIGGEQISEDNEIRFRKMKYISEKHFSEMKKGILLKGDVLMVKDGATTGKMGFWDFDYRAAVNEHVFIFRAKNKISPKYLFSILRSNSFQYELKPYIKGIIGGISLEIKKIQIPLPPLEIQEQIVAELDGYASIIAGAKQITKNWKPKINTSPEWEKVSIAAVCEIGDGNHSSNYPKASEMVQSGVPFIRGTNLVDGKIDANDIKYISNEKHVQLKKGHLKTNDILFTNRGEIGKVAIVDERFNGANLNSQIAWLRSKENLVPLYLISVLMSDYTQSQLLSLKQGATLQQFTIRQLSSFKIPLPPIEIQKEIVEKIEAERTLVESAKKLIAIYDQKTKEMIEKLWNE